ncbi:MAG: nitrous oxide reductase family maturation protein NosD [Candidatus Krumholzibacteria bacterium]|nr:nitrous oxide reductase family maturation protein NosD [Candidatus Krumholzibacteria bacterium]MDH4337623.1 nitrous oxide reductase family maturation protein NosD [Candidatus Krumholzibacteria bacterium]MDH5270425.1 nitrous oxide reductase family maturation protein NosD [Candidatus Krumholzibacteria bacterium]
MAAAAIIRHTLIPLAVASALAGAISPTRASTVRVGHDEPCTSIASALALAGAGDTILVAPGLYNEFGLIIDKSIVLDGGGTAVIDAAGQGAIITVTAPGVTIRGFTLRNVGSSFTEDRAAIRLRQVKHARVENNRLERAFFGIYVEHCDSVVIRANTLEGPETRETDNGNGIHLWYTKHARIEDNRISGHRDGIYFEFVENSVVARNMSTRNQRYGLHFMFSHHDDYFDNHFVANGAGVAVMYTNDVVMRGNTFEDNWGTNAYGLLLKDINRSTIAHNQFRGNTVGLYAEGSGHLHVEDNDFNANGYAIRIMANSMDNVFTGNRFMDNAFDVVTNSRQSFNTFDGNYWSEYRGYDLDKDGVGDVPHHPVRLFALLVEKAPPGVVLLKSLFVSLIDTAERVMPVFTPETLVDSRPLMSPGAPVQTTAVRRDSR